MLYLLSYQRLYHGAMQFTDLSNGEENQPYYLPRVEEEVEISDSMAVISVPPPRFRPGDPAYILHDFNRVRMGNSCGPPWSCWCPGRVLTIFTYLWFRSWPRIWIWLWGPALWFLSTLRWSSLLRTSLTSSHNWWWVLSTQCDKGVHRYSGLITKTVDSSNNIMFESIGRWLISPTLFTRFIALCSV